MNDALEPFDGAELRRFFEREYKARLVRSNGAHLVMELPDGRQVGCMNSTTTVTKSLMRLNARQLGISYAELRNQISPKQRKNKPRFRTETHPRRVTSKKDALTSLDSLIGDVTAIKRTICNGDRDPAVYRRICDAVRKARGSLKTHNKVKR